VETFLLRDRSDLRTNGQGREPRRSGTGPCLYRGLQAGGGGAQHMAAGERDFSQIKIKLQIVCSILIIKAVDLIGLRNKI